MKRFINELGNFFIPENEKEREILDMHENLMFDLSSLTGFREETDELRNLGYENISNEYWVDDSFEYPEEENDLYEIR